LNLYGSLQQLLSAARRRALSHALLRELILAAAVGFAVAAVVLLAGTERLGAYWIPLAALVTLAGRLIFEFRRRPSPYAIAQRIDERLHLFDTISTAAYFADAPDPRRRVDPALRDMQRARAEEAARSVDLKRALPLTRPFALYPSAILACVVAGLFLLRFAATGSFDPKASLVEGPLKALLGAAEKQARANKQPGPGQEPGNSDDTSKELDKNRDYAGEPEGQKESSPEAAEEAEAQKGQQEKGEGQKGDQAADSQPSQDPSNLEKSPEQGREQDGRQQESLLDKLKDAVSDMMNKMKPSSNKQPQKNQNGKNGERKPGEGQEKSSDMDDKNPGDNADSENHNRGNDMDNSGLSAEGEKDDNEHSGIGSQEGDKSARQAEALKAMGKITELFGKRAENVTGAVMIEVGSTRQQLKTPLAQRDAAHAEAGSEIHRDEVPLEYEQYVQRYFDQIRRTPPAAPAAPKAGN
jgi:hypothetical protein